jgi:hypothetical protein
MELAVRLSAVGQDAGTVDRSGVLVALVCSLVLLAVGVAHYRGAARWLAHWGILSEYTVLALAWLGAGGVLSTAAILLADQESTVAAVLTVVVGIAGLAAGVVGIVGIVWLPRALRPRWLLDSQADPALRDPGPGARTERRRSGR